MISTANKVFGPRPKGQVRKFVLLIVLLTCPCGTWSGSASGYDEEAADKTTEEMKKYRFEKVTTKEGLSFSIPSDMPIERKDGLVQPIPFDEYLYIKFKQIEDRVTKLEERQDKMEDRLMAEFRQLKEMIAELKPKNDPSQPAQPAPPAPKTAS